jgi:hypothetical protein
MKVAIARGGGVAGLTSKTRLTSEGLGADDAEALAERVHASRLLTDPEAEPRSARGADQLLYAVTVDDGERERTHRFTEESLPEEVRSLIEWVDAHPDSERDVQPPG